MIYRWRCFPYRDPAPSIGVHIKQNQIQTRTNLGHKPQWKKVAPNSKFLGILLKLYSKAKLRSLYIIFFFLVVWIDSPSVTVVETLAHPIDEVSFPAVTICPQDFNSDRWGTTIKIMDYFQWKCPTLG